MTRSFSRKRYRQNKQSVHVFCLQKSQVRVSILEFFNKQTKLSKKIIY